MLLLLAVKVLLAPGFVVALSLAGRRFGPQVAGLFGGVPVVAGPILLVLSIANGPGFGAEAAAGTLLGIVSLLGSVITYGLLAPRLPWPASMGLSWTAFLAATAALNRLTMSSGVALALALAAIPAALALLPRGQARASSAAVPLWDLPLRAVSAMAMVVALTGASASLGSRLSGLLTPFPVVTSVLAAFTHAQRGAGEVLVLLRGFTLGFVAFALFSFTLAVSLPAIGIAGGFLVATGVALLTQSAMALLLRARTTRIAEVGSR
jgi:hypothetical protein